MTVSLFTPIKVDGFPDSSLELSRYNAAVNQRTILIRSISYIISGISVIIAFVSLLQNKTSELKRERLQVMPFPAYALFGDNSRDYLRTSTILEINREYRNAEVKLKGNFEVLIKNIGLGSLVDYEIKKAYYQSSRDTIEKLDLAFFNNCILGKEESIKMQVKINTDFKTKEDPEEIIMIVSFKDLLGHKYLQEFTIKFDTRLEEKNAGEDVGIKKSSELYSIEAIEIMHTHPKEQKKSGEDLL